MNRKVNIYYVKDLGKTAFAIGLGLTVGKCVGDLVNASISGVIIGTVSHFANSGNETAKEVCDSLRIKYGQKKQN